MRCARWTTGSLDPEPRIAGVADARSAPSNDPTIQAFVVPGPVTVQEKLLIPVVALERDEASVLQVDPPFRLISMLTVSSAPRLCRQEIVRVEPTFQISPPFGASTVIDGGARVRPMTDATDGLRSQRTRRVPRTWPGR